MKAWARGLLVAAVTGAANAVLLVIVAPDKFSFGDLQELGTVAFAMTLVNVAMYLKQSPLPNTSSRLKDGK